MDNGSFLTIGEETDIPFDEVIVGHRAGSTRLQLSFLNEAATPFTLQFGTPAEAGKAAVRVASAKANGEDLSIGDLEGVICDGEQFLAA